MEQMISLQEGRVHIDIVGQGSSIVLLPGLGEACPCIEMKPFAQALMADFQVITFEPFGYGGSDPATTPRTIENMAEELHAALSQLKIEKYAIAAHSISGLYALHYLNRYPQEITAFIALDMSVPQQFATEFARQELTAAAQMRKEQLNAADQAALDQIRQEAVGFLKMMTDHPYTEEEMAVYGNMAVKCAHDPTVLDELERIAENNDKVKELRVPDECPALMLIARENTKRLAQWEEWHRAVSGASTEIHILECDHYVHLMKTQETAALIRRLLL